MSKVYDWNAFRNETAARIAANLAVDHQSSYHFDDERLVEKAISIASTLTIRLLELENKMLEEENQEDEDEEINNDNKKKIKSRR